MLKDDPTITRIRETRHKISEQFQHDPKKLIEHYIELQQKHKERLLRTELNQLSRTEEIHLEKEFENFDKLYSHE
ncbi:MAG: hypothetical protein AAB071_07465 [Bacteroidota bacterium]